MGETQICVMNAQYAKERSISPMDQSPRFERNIGVFNAITRRLGLRSHDDLYSNGEEDSNCSSTDSSSSNGNGGKDLHISNYELSCNSSDTSSTVDENEDKSNNSTSRLHRRSTSSIRKAFEGFSIRSTRSHSCSSSNTPSSESIKQQLQKINSAASQKQPKETKQPQRILRQPVKYTYLKGISGLPTQRVPSSQVCCMSRR